MVNETSAMVNYCSCLSRCNLYLLTYFLASNVQFTFIQSSGTFIQSDLQVFAKLLQEHFE